MISQHARFRIQYGNMELSRGLYPFIGFVGELVAAGHPLAESARRGFERFPDAQQFFAEPADPDDVLHLQDDIMFSEWRPVSFEYLIGDRGNRMAIAADPWQATKLLRLVFSERFSEVEEDPRGRALARELRQAGLFTPAVRDRRLDFAPDGVYRLQHACILVRYRGVGILVDPHLHSGFTIDYGDDVTLEMLKPFVDAIVLTHPHEDHMYLTTLLMFDAEIPIVVPPAAGNSIVSCDMTALLRAAGFRNVVAPAWWAEPVRIGEILVHALPFYGEQMLVDRAIPNPAFRNAGSTYLFETGAHRTWILIDSGREHLGTMWQAAEEVYRRFGAVDAVLSNLSEFTMFGPYYINSGLNWLCLPADDKSRMPDMRKHLMTLGPSGAARVCKNVRARRYAPYAHWWGPVAALGGTSGGTSDQERYEAKQLVRLREQFAANGARTEIVEWVIGERLAFGV